MAIEKDELLEEVKCLGCVGLSYSDAIIIALLQRIAENTGSGGGGGEVGLVWGPNAHTVAVMDASSDNFLGPLNSQIFLGSAFTSLSFGNPVTVLGNANFDGYSGASLEWRLMQTVVGDFQCTGSGAGPLVSISAPNLATVGGDMFFTSHPSLVSVSLPVFVPTNGKTISFNSGALSATSVNHILARCVAAGLTASTIDLSGGTSSAPTGQGIADKATLIGNGCTVTTN